MYLRVKWRPYMTLFQCRKFERKDHFKINCPSNVDRIQYTNTRYLCKPALKAVNCDISHSQRIDKNANYLS